MLNQNKLLILGALCAALATTQTPCAQEEAPTFTPDLIDQQHPDGQKQSAQADGAPKQDFFDVKAFVERVERGELSDEEIRANMDRQNPFVKYTRGSKQPIGYSTATPPIYATQNRLNRALKTFIDLRADLKSLDQAGYTALMRAGYHNNHEAVALLADAKAAIDYQGKDRCTALMCAVSRGELDATKALLAANADVNMRDRYNQTALMKTVVDSHPSSELARALLPEIARALLEAKADQTVVDTTGRTVGMYAGDTHSYPEEKKAITALLIAAGGNPEQEAQEAEKRINASLDFLLQRQYAPASAKPESKQEENSLVPENKKPKTVKTPTKVRKRPCCQIM